MNPAIALANTTYLLRGRPADVLGTPEELANWLRKAGNRLSSPVSGADLASVSATDLAAARELRAAIRAIADATVAGQDPGQEWIDVLNRRAGAARRWSELRWRPRPHTEVRTSSSPVSAALAEIAGAAVELFGGPDRAELRACHAPRCILYFVKDHPRREFCSAGCANRARAARHYRRTRSGR